MVPYDASYDLPYGTVRRTIVRNRTTGRMVHMVRCTVAYDALYGSVRFSFGIIRFRTTVRHTVPSVVSHGSVQCVVWFHMIVHCMESYGVSYGPVRIISRANYLKPLGARII